MVKIALSRTVSEINGFLCFTQKFKMAAKNDGKTIFWGKSRQMIADSLGVKNLVKIALSCIISEINAFLHFMHKFKCF